MLVWGLGGLRAKLKEERALLSRLVMALYVNDYTPTVNSQVSDFDLASFDGYDSVPLSDWGDPFISSGSVASLVHPVVSWTWKGSGDPPKVYGFFVVDKQFENFFYGERYRNAPFVFSLADPTFRVVPRQDLRNIA